MWCSQLQMLELTDAQSCSQLQMQLLQLTDAQFPRRLQSRCQRLTKASSQQGSLHGRSSASEGHQCQAQRIRSTLLRVPAPVRDASKRVARRRDQHQRINR